MESERLDAGMAAEHIFPYVSNNHLANESGSLEGSSHGSMSADAETVASENASEHLKSADLDDAGIKDEKEMSALAEEDKLHKEVVKSTTNLGSQASQNLPEKDVETNEASKLVNKVDSNIKTVKKRNKRLKKTTEKRTAFDGRKVVYVTECTQTDWKWKDKAEKSDKGTVLPTSVADSPTGDKVTSAGSRSGSIKSAEAKSDSRQSMGQSQDEMESKKEIVTVTDLTPFFLVPDDEFGIPVVEMSADSDTSNEEPYERPKFYRHHLPSIGPPQILKYIRESEILEKTGEKTNESWDYVLREASTETLAFEEHGSSLGMFSGPCEFCGTDIKPFPSLDQQLSEPPDSLYCCEEYREFVEFATTTAVRMEEEKMKDQQQISIKVHAHHGSAHDRQLAKERAVQRMHERELQRRQQEANGLQAVFHQIGQVSIKSGGSSDYQSDDVNIINDPGSQMHTEDFGDAISSEDYEIVEEHVIEGELSNRVRKRNTFRKEGGMVTDETEAQVNHRKEPGKGRKELGKGGYEPGRGGYEPGRTGYEPGRTGYEPGRTGYEPGRTEQELGRAGQRQKGKRRGHIRDSSHEHNAEEAGSPYRRMRNRGAQRGVVSGGLQTHHFSLGMQAGPRSMSSSFGPLNIEVARQMKTINYQLSSQRCLEEGWTLRAPSPMGNDDAESDMFVPEPLHPAMIVTGKLQDRPIIEKFYQNGSKFLTIFPDGTGNVFYPSGRLAILISSIALGQNTFVVQDDSDAPVLLGVFEPNGYGCCCFANDKIRLTYDPLEGLELDYTGALKRAWSWKDQEAHIHAPPFQPIVFGMNNYLGIRFMAQENIALTFTGRKRSCRFNVGVKLKMVNPDNFRPKVIQEDELLITEHKIRVETILNKVSNLLKFPKSPKVDRILPPLSVSVRRQKMEKLKQASLSSHKSQKPFKQTKLPPLDSAAVSVN